MTAKFLRDIAAEMIRDRERYPIQFVTGKEPLAQRFAMLRANYQSFQRAVDDGRWDWMCHDPYVLADWTTVFTPIEEAAWCDIRCAGLPMWPQFPVGRFFVDFGNPLVRVALECDGKDYHDAARDAARDAELAILGWRVLRAPGWRCKRVMDSPAERADSGYEVDDEYAERYARETLGGLMAELKLIFQRKGLL